MVCILQHYVIHCIKKGSFFTQILLQIAVVFVFLEVKVHSRKFMSAFHFCEQSKINVYQPPLVSLIEVFFM